jgi:hypothetical protein
MPAAPDADHGAGAWANYTGPRAPAQAAAARPWPSAAAASPSDGSGPWAAALPQGTTAASSAQQAQAASASQPAAAAAAGAQQSRAAASQPAAPATAAPSAWEKWGDYYVVWQVDTDESSWTDYDRKWSDRLEKHWRVTAEAKRFTAIPCGTVGYTYDVGEFWQQNNETGRKRLIRRVLIGLQEHEHLAARRVLVAEHNKNHHSLEAWHRRRDAGNARSRSKSASGSVSRSRSRAD